MRPWRWPATVAIAGGCIQLQRLISRATRRLQPTADNRSPETASGASGGTSRWIFEPCSDADYRLEAIRRRATTCLAGAAAVTRQRVANRWPQSSSCFRVRGTFSRCSGIQSYSKLFKGTLRLPKTGCRPTRRSPVVTPWLTWPYTRPPHSMANATTNSVRWCSSPKAFSNCRRADLLRRPR
jgi:hypothetical protein